MPFWSALPAIFGGASAIRGGSALAQGVAPYAGHGATGGVRGAVGHFLRSPIVQGGQFGIGYTGGAYSGYGISNTFDPLGIHKPKYKYVRQSLGMPYGSYGYGRRYRRRYRSRYSRYGRRSRYGYRRRSYRRYSRYY